MLLVIELFALVYVFFLIWFWSLCRISARRERAAAEDIHSRSNLIPFERGIRLSLRKTARS
ncbi:hypothetical protein [Paracidobacterium acidisoli]|uniref:Uncharacterized protein n=1 Tax=Paracidobacterium acidisoli TaxID=2303751 RepID=A0A372IQH9_9BACT|nr:hypothetical protein [Paracidobacterium acidisoli]MBT9331363.1 hypothetical protein [Paracidobacterium acidisoli]